MNLVVDVENQKATLECNVGMKVATLEFITYEVIRPDADDMIGRITALEKVYEAAKGLCYGTDWNKGNQAITHGYRKKLIDAVKEVGELLPH